MVIVHLTEKEYPVVRPCPPVANRSEKVPIVSGQEDVMQPFKSENVGFGQRGVKKKLVAIGSENSCLRRPQPRKSIHYMSGVQFDHTFPGLELKP
jgi:hypothetical protein